MCSVRCVCLLANRQRQEARQYILIDKVETAVVWHESRDFFSILDELSTDTLSNGGIGLFGFDATRATDRDC